MYKRALVFLNSGGNPCTIAKLFDQRLDHCWSSWCKNAYALHNYVDHDKVAIILMVYHACLLSDGYSTSAISL